MSDQWEDQEDWADGDHPSWDDDDGRPGWDNWQWHDPYDSVGWATPEDQPVPDEDEDDGEYYEYPALGGLVTDEYDTMDFEDMDYLIREPWQESPEEENCSTDSDVSVRPRKRRRLSSAIRLRPLNCPNAPENSTQFIIDDHSDCNLYRDFDEQDDSKVCTCDDEEDDDEKNCSKCGMRRIAAGVDYSDIDYEYESPDDVSYRDFFYKDFEMAYQNYREEELENLTSSDITVRILQLRETAERQEVEIEASRACALMNRLQTELLHLQEENEKLRKRNRLLRQLDGQPDVPKRRRRSVDLSYEIDTIGIERTALSVDTPYDYDHSGASTSFWGVLPISEEETLRAVDINCDSRSSSSLGITCTKKSPHHKSPSGRENVAPFSNSEKL